MKNNQNGALDRERSDITENTVGATPAATPTEGEPQPDVEVVGVSFRTSGKKYYFAPGRLTLHVGNEVIVETARGMEFGKVVIANTTVPASAITPPLRIVTRLATPTDRERYERNRELEVEALRTCREKVAQHKLEMNLIGAEYTFDNSKLLFYFTADGRVDFRELVKDLASVFHTRIELRQVGIRDEARILGGLGACGRPFCCSTFLPDFTQVSIKMAKEQNFSLNSAKVSGACGRLMCCLRFEHESYEEALKTTPPNGALVDTSAGTGIVIETRPLLQLVKVRLDDKPEAPRLFTCEEITVLRHKAPKNDEERARAVQQAQEQRAPRPAAPKPEATAEDRREERREEIREERREERRAERREGGQGQNNQGGQGQNNQGGQGQNNQGGQKHGNRGGHRGGHGRRQRPHKRGGGGEKAEKKQENS